MDGTGSAGICTADTLLPERLDMAETVVSVGEDTGAKDPVVVQLGCGFDTDVNCSAD